MNSKVAVPTSRSFHPKGKQNSGCQRQRKRLSAVNSLLITVSFCELGVEQKDLSRVIDPYENDDERARGAVSRGYITAPDVQADQMLAERE
jgi:hypothetical protein